MSVDGQKSVDKQKLVMWHEKSQRCKALMSSMVMADGITALHAPQVRGIAQQRLH